MSRVVEGYLAVLDDHPHGSRTVDAGVGDGQPVSTVVMRRDPRDPRMVALNHESRVEVFPELGPRDHPVAMDDDRRHPALGALVAEVLEDAAQDDRSPLLPRRVGTIDTDEGTVLAVDHGTGSEVEPGELAPCPHCPGKLIHTRRETECAPSMMSIDEPLQVVAGCDLHTVTGRPERRTKRRGGRLGRAQCANRTRPSTETRRTICPTLASDRISRWDSSIARLGAIPALRPILTRGPGPTVEPETSKHLETHACEESPAPVDLTATSGLHQSDEPSGRSDVGREPEQSIPPRHGEPASSTNPHVRVSFNVLCAGSRTASGLPRS